MAPKTRILLLLLTVAVASFIGPTTAFRRLPHFALSRRGGGASTKTIKNAQQKAAARELGFLHRYATRLFEDADTNHDGSISPSEVYELVLKFYVKVNQQAPVPPPTRQRVMYLFRQADTDRGGRLDLDQFRRLMRTIYARASSRVVVFKIVSMILAPATAITLVGKIQAMPSLMEFLGSLLPEWVPPVLANLLSKESFWVTIFTVLMVKELSMVMLRLVDWYWLGKLSDQDDKMYETIETLIKDD